jgi:uncharacterized protein with HEPN domain
MSFEPREFLIRDRLIHGYFGVDYDLIWDVVTNRIPPLKAAIARIVNDLDQ